MPGARRVVPSWLATDEMTEHPDFWVLCSFRPGDAEEFYVLSHAEMARAQAARNSGEALTWVENAEKVKTGVDNVLAKDLQDYMSAWNKIVTWCTADSSHPPEPTRRS